MQKLKKLINKKALKSLIKILNFNNQIKVTKAMTTLKLKLGKSQKFEITTMMKTAKKTLQCKMTKNCHLKS